MSDQYRARFEARARILRELGVSLAESALFTAVHYGFTIPPSDLPARAAQEDHNPFGPRVNEEDCRVALIACLAKGWLQVIDEPTRAKIADELRRDRVLGPIYGGLPEVGCVDFTAAGAELWRRLGAAFGRDTNPPFAYTEVVHERTDLFFQSWVAATAAIEEAYKKNDVENVTGPSSTGPWRAQWWRRFPEGYKIGIEERRQWQGQGPRGGESCYLCRPDQEPDLHRLHQSLDRHKVSSASWLILAALERGPFELEAAKLPWCLAQSARSNFGVSITAEEYRSGLEACLRDGWLRVVNQQVINEIHDLLQNDSAFLAIPSTAEIRPEGCCFRIGTSDRDKFVPVRMPFESQWGKIDFSPVGANLYRLISAEWLGTDWENDLHVSNVHYWEEHHYCEVEDSFQCIVQEHEAKGDVVRASRVIPIGPWCVYWWERFPAGYRLELELGAP